MKASRIAGFSLAETMIGLSIGLALAGTAAWFLVEGTRISLKTAAASTNDLAEWGILTSITVDTKTANGMVMYPDFLKTTVSDSTKRISAKGTFGNVLVLTQSVQGTTASYQQLTGYVYDPTYKTFKKFVYIVPTTIPPSTDSLETILNSNYDTLVFQTIATNVSTIGTLPGAFLCRDADQQSGELNVQISGGTAALSTSNTKIIETSFFVRG